MSEEESNICADCGKKIQENKGSMTQWIGLGDSCKCNQQEDVEISRKTSTKSSKKTKKCKRCLKPIGSNQSMTQWLIRKETCKCPTEIGTTVATNYTQQAMSKKSLHRVGREAENRAPVAIVVAGVLLFVLVCGYSIFQTSGLSDKWKLNAGRYKGNDRRMLLSYNGAFLATCHPPTTENEWNATAFQNANQLIVKDSTIGDDELEQLAKHVRLDMLVLKNCDGFTATGVRALRKIPDLVSVSLESSKIDTEILKALGTLQIDGLDLTNTNVAAADWSVLLANQSLNRLKVYGVPISAANRDAFAKSGFRVDSEHFVRHWLPKYGSRKHEK